MSVSAFTASLQVGVALPACTLGGDYGPLRMYAVTTRRTTQAGTVASRAASTAPPLVRPRTSGKRKAKEQPSAPQRAVPTASVTEQTTSQEEKEAMPPPAPKAPLGGPAAGRTAPDQSDVSPISLAPEVFIQHQQRDSYCSAFADYIRDGQLPEDDDLAATVVATHSEFNVTEEGMLVRFNSVPSKGDKVFVHAVAPQTLRPLVLRLAHDDASAGHGGISATHLRIANNYWWPTLAIDVRTYVSSCNACQQRKPGRTTQVDQVVRRPARLWENFQLIS